MTLKKNKIKWEYLIVIIIGLALFIMMTRLFYFQAINHNGNYNSDTPTHIEIAINKKGYSILYWIIGLVYNITQNVFWVAVVESILVMATWLFSMCLIMKLMPKICLLKSAMIALVLNFITGIYIPIIYEYFYVRQLVTQPYHNITYYGMRLFSVITILIFSKIFDTYLKQIKCHQWILLSFMLMLSTAVKPSFFYGFAITLLLFLIIDFCKNRFQKPQFQNMILLGMTVFPSLLIMILQANVLYGGSSSGNGSGIAIIWGANFVKYGAFQTIMKLLCNLLFPTFVILMNWKRLKRIDKFVGVMFLVQLIICILFVETGNRSGHGNFYWGLYNAAYLLFLFCIVRFCENIDNQYGKRIYRIVGGVVLMLHLISGFEYFVHIYSGGGYRI